MNSLAIIEDLDVLSYFPSGFCPAGKVAVMHLFLFKYAPKALHGSIVIAVASAAHGNPEASLSKQELIIPGAILTALVRVLN